MQIEEMLGGSLEDRLMHRTFEMQDTVYRVVGFTPRKGNFKPPCLVLEYKRDGLRYIEVADFMVFSIVTAIKFNENGIVELLSEWANKSAPGTV